MQRDAETAGAGDAASPLPGRHGPGRLGDAPELARIIAFLREIGLAVVATPLPADTVLPGMTVTDGRLLYDPDARGRAGDLLHEAGHLAVTDPVIRDTLPSVMHDPVEEMATLAWSYAAAVAIGVAPDIVFHEGYPGGGSYLIAAFAGEGAPGVPMLRLWSMTPHAGASGPHFPTMTCWLRPGP